MSERPYHKRKFYSIIFSSLLIIIFIVTTIVGNVFPTKIFANEAGEVPLLEQHLPDEMLVEDNIENGNNHEETTELEEETIIIVNPPSTPAWFTNLPIISETSIELEWSQADTALGYNIYRDGELLIQLLESTTNFIDLSVTPNKTYYYELEAFNEGGVSEVIDLYVETLDTEPPIPAAVIKGKAVTANQIHLIWSPAIDNRGVAYYNIYYSREDEEFTLTHSQITDQFYIHEGLGPSFTFNYVITAVDTSGNESAPSKIVSIRTSDDLFDVVYEKLPLSVSLDD